MTDKTEKNDIKPPKYILTLDGGGIRGVYTAQLITLINECLGYPIQSKFDLIVGTSIGGLLAGMMCHQPHEMNPFGDIFNLHNIETIFNKSIWDRILGFLQFCPIYDGQGKREIIKNSVGDIKLGELKTHIIITSWNLTENKPWLFSTIDQTQKDTYLYEACDATSAAPIYFPPVLINHNFFIDGGVGANNPILIGYSEAAKLWPDHPLHILSIGTGIEPQDAAWKTSGVQTWGAVQWVANGLLELFMDAPNDLMMNQMEFLFKNLGGVNSNNQLLRLNAMVPSISLDDTNQEHLKILKQKAQETFQKNVEKIKLFF